MSDLPSLDLKLDDPPPAPPPGSKHKGRPKGSRNKPKGLTDSELKKALEQALVFPSIPSMIFYPTPAGKMYLSTHFTLTAPWGADQLVMAAKLSPPLRAQLEKIARGGVAGILLSFAAVYLGGPALFILGQQAAAEGLTASTQMDEEQTGAAMQAMFGGMMAGSPGDSAPADGGNMAEQNGSESQTDPQGEPQPGFTESADWVGPQPEPDPPISFT